jgi:membrane protein DedA with SNARE-associated domain
LQDLIAEATRFLTEHSAWAGPIIGVLAFGESLILIGMFIPATPLMLGVGSLIGLGLIEPISVLLCAMVGAVLGDWISYEVGRWIGPSCYRQWPLRNHRSGVARARLFFSRYGFASILLARFFGPVRATIPVVAGVMGMPLARFQTANILSAFLWVPGLFAPGYLTAQSIGPVEEITEFHVAAAGFAIVGTMIFGFWIVSKVMGGRRRSSHSRP